MGGIRAGTLHAGSADGTNWAAADFAPAATDALYFNACGWANLSDGGYATGSTPFNTYPGLLFNSVPGAANIGDYVEALATGSSQTQALATDLAYYALNGTFPDGVTLSTLPAQAWPGYTCSGSPD